MAVRDGIRKAESWMLREVRPVACLFATISAVLLTACTLPNEQLSLPTAISPPLGGSGRHDGQHQQRRRATGNRGRP